MKKRVLHATSGNKAEKIIKEGFYPDVHIWNCSTSNMYVWDYSKLCESENWDENKDEFYALQRANESGQITAALEKEPLNYTVVFDFEIDEKYLNMDYSCPNMEDACIITQEVFNSLYKNKEIILKIHKFEFCIKLSYLYLIGIINNNFLNIDEFLSTQEIHLLKSLQNNDIYFEELFFPELIETI